MHWLESAILLLASVLAYAYWKPWLRPPVREMLSGDATLYFFYTDWCGHSKKAKPEWEKFIAGLPATYGTTKVTAKAVNCEEDVTTCVAYGVDAYPTVKLETSSGLHDFTQRVTESSLDGFLTGELGKKE